MLKIRFEGEWLPILTEWIEERFRKEDIHGEFTFYGIEDVIERKVDWNTISGFTAEGFNTIESPFSDRGYFGFSIVLRMGELGLASMEYLLDCLVKNLKK